MNYLASADIQCHMVNAPALCIENQIARLRLRHADLPAGVCLGTGSSRQGYSVFLNTLRTKPEQSAPFVRLVPPHT